MFVYLQLVVAYRSNEELLYHSNLITFYAEQLSMLTNVKRSTSPFDLTIKALATNGDNLMKSILKSLNAAESVLLKVGVLISYSCCHLGK